MGQTERTAELNIRQAVQHALDEGVDRGRLREILEHTAADVAHGANEVA